MSCDRIASLLSAFADGELAAADEHEVRAHVAACPRCAARLETVRALRAAVRSVRPERSDDGLAAFRRRLRSTPAPSRRRSAWAGIAAGLALFAAGSVWVARQPFGNLSQPAPEALEPVAEAALAASSSPCAQAVDCGEGAREVWPALDI